MRCALALVIAACTPDISPDAYLCGPEQLCPDGLVCSGSNFACENPATVQPFACDAPITETALPPLPCVSGPIAMSSCLPAGATSASFQLTTPANCTSVGVFASVDFPFAFESLDLVVADATGARIGSDGDCAMPADGLDSRCIATTLANSTTYQVEVVPGGNDCDGDCNYNQYTLSVQLVTPVGP